MNVNLRSKHFRVFRCVNARKMGQTQLGFLAYHGCLPFTEIPIGKSNGSYHSIWSTSEIMGFWSK